MGHMARAGADTTPQQAASPAETCNYVADLALEMRALCKHNDLNHLAYLFEIVFIEASEEALKLKAPAQASTDE